MRVIQQNLTSYKIYIEAQRSQIFGDNNAGLTDPAKLFEGVICIIYNLYYDTKDFKVFAKSNFPSVDIKSDNKKIVVSVKARQTHLSKKSIENDIERLHSSHLKYKSYIFILQQLCDKPSAEISVENCEIRYFGDLANLFVSKPQQLAQLVEVLYRKENNIVRISYLSYLSDRYFKYITSQIKQIYNLDIRHDFSYNDFKIDNFNVVTYRRLETDILKNLNGVWTDIQDKKYLSLRITSESILLLDSLWRIGHLTNRFKPHFFFQLIGNETTGDPLIQQFLEDKNPENTFSILHNYLVNVYLSITSLKMYLLHLSN